MLELDVNRPGDLAALADELRTRWGTVDGVLYAIAHAPADAFGGDFLATPPDSAEAAFRTSRLLAQRARRRPAAAAGGRAARWSGRRARLRRQRRLPGARPGPEGVRVNLVAAGPVATPAAGGIPGFDDLAGGWAERAPLGWDPGDPAPIAAAACFLLSDMARGVTGDILHVDGGAHAIGATAPTTVRTGPRQ